MYEMGSFLPLAVAEVDPLQNVVDVQRQTGSRLLRPAGVQLGA